MAGMNLGEMTYIAPTRSNARKRFGRIAIANSDAAANAMFEAAVEQGYRAVLDLYEV